MANNLVEYEHIILQMYQDGCTDSEVSNHLAELGMQRGFSERSPRRFRAEREFTTRHISDEEAEMAISKAIIEVSVRFYPCQFFND